MIVGLYFHPLVDPVQVGLSLIFPAEVILVLALAPIVLAVEPILLSGAPYVPLVAPVVPYRNRHPLAAVSSGTSYSGALGHRADPKSCDHNTSKCRKAAFYFS
jgi:hypothetical protein